jgi:hypothetical protein
MSILPPDGQCPDIGSGQAAFGAAKARGGPKPNHRLFSAGVQTGSEIRFGIYCDLLAAFAGGRTCSWSELESRPPPCTPMLDRIGRSPTLHLACYAVGSSFTSILLCPLALFIMIMHMAPTPAQKTPRARRHNARVNPAVPGTPKIFAISIFPPS